MGKIYISERDRCRVCFRKSQSSQMCLDCWRIYSRKCVDAVNSGKFNLSDPTRHAVDIGGINYIDIMLYIKAFDLFPKDERAMNLLKYGPMPEG